MLPVDCASTCASAGPSGERARAIGAGTLTSTCPASSNSATRTSPALFWMRLASRGSTCRASAESQSAPSCPSCSRSRAMLYWMFWRSQRMSRTTASRFSSCSWR
jgi:hypothetical protein